MNDIKRETAACRELADCASRWPSRLHARLNTETEHWTLLGADKSVLSELRICVERAARDLGLSSKSDPVEAFLWLLSDAGHCVKQTKEDTKQRNRSTKIVAKVTARCIAPLGDAVIEYLRQRPLGTPSRLAQPKPTTESAAEKNQRRDARVRVIEALKRLEIPQAQWPSFVEKPQWPPNWQPATADKFQPPDFDRLHQSLADWRKAADLAWQQHREEQIRRWEFWVTLDVEERARQAKRPRGPGRKRRNARPDARYEWAARRLAGLEYKQIAIDYSVKEDRVRKAVTTVLLTAGWLKDQAPEAEPLRPLPPYQT